MNREIKFRAWDDEMLVDVIPVRPEGEETPAIIIVNAFTHSWKLRDVQSIMQYIGSLDKNGVEIYEGDLIRDTDSEFVGEVVWDEDTLCFTTKFQSNNFWGFVPHKGKDNHCEVIGNIYENETK